MLHKRYTKTNSLTPIRRPLLPIVHYLALQKRKYMRIYNRGNLRRKRFNPGPSPLLSVLVATEERRLPFVSLLFIHDVSLTNPLRRRRANDCRLLSISPVQKMLLVAVLEKGTCTTKVLSN